jgi:predicted porin
MQKKIIALAIAGLASTAAFAQSNVTIYGVADSTFDVVKASGGVNSGLNIGTFTRVSTNSSLIGFKGAEALGNGLTAVFQYESSVSFDSGAAFGGTNRDSYIGIAGGFGTIALGNLTGPTRALGASLDVNAGATGIGANSAIIGKLAGVAVSTAGANDATSNFNVLGACGRSGTCASTFDSRWKNAIAYISPNFGGVTVTAAYVANENKTNDAASGTAAQRNTKGYDLGVNYKNGPIMAGLTYNFGSMGNAQGTDVGLVRLGGSYDFGMGTVRAMYDWAKANDILVGGDSLKQQDYGIGLTFKVGAGNIVGQYYAAKNTTGNFYANNSNRGAKLFSLGYEHSLSKRTMVKAVYSRLASDDHVAYDYGVNSIGAADFGGTLQGVQVGLRHTF